MKNTEEDVLAKLAGEMTQREILIEILETLKVISDNLKYPNRYTTAGTTWIPASGTTSTPRITWTNHT